MSTDDASQLAVEVLADERGGPLVKVSGQLDMSTEAAFRKALDESAIDRSNVLTLDISELSFMDSSGLAVLLGAAHEFAGIMLRNPTAIVRRVITISGLTESLRMSPDA